MLFVCWSWKGGVGTSVVVAGLALAGHQAGSLVVDLAGDQASLFGLSEPEGPDLTSWLLSPDAPVDGLPRLERELTSGVSLLGAHPGVDPSPERQRLLAEVLGADRRLVVVDAGRLEPDGPIDPFVLALIGRADQALLVTRACYLSLRRAARAQPRPTGIVLCAEPGRALGADDVAGAVGAPVVARVPVEPVVARMVDAGLLAGRPPRNLVGPLRSLARP